MFAPLLMLITAFAMLAASGGAPLVSIAMGEGNKERAEKNYGELVFNRQEVRGGEKHVYCM